MNALRQLGARVSEQLASGRRPVDYSALSDAQLNQIIAWRKVELTEPEAHLLALIRQTLLDDAAGFAAEWLEMQEGLDKDLLRAVLSYWSRESSDDRDLAAACAIAENVLTEGTA